MNTLARQIPARARWPVMLSLLLNFLLLGGALHQLHRPWPEASAGPLLQVATNHLSAPPPSAQAPRIVCLETNALQWAQVASTSWHAYATNLLAIGCPLDVVADIIVSEVNHAFVRARHARYAPIHAHFWEHVFTNGPAKDLDFDDYNDSDLRKHRETILEAVLGPHWKKLYERGRWNAHPPRELAFLSLEKRRLMMQITEHSNSRRADLHRELSKQPDERKAHLAVLEQETAAARHALVTPDEAAEYRARRASGAEWAQHLEGFEASEAEFRALAALRADIPASRTNEFYAQARARLGGDRFAALQRCADRRFQEIRSEVSQCKAPEDLATQLYESRVQAEGLAAAVRANRTLPVEQRTALLAQIQEQTRQAVNQTLGSTLAEKYHDRGGAWLLGLAKP